MSQQLPTIRTLEFRWGHEIVARPVDWLWQPWLARGTIAVLDGDPGVGKSSVALDLAARVTTGQPFPGETAARQPAVALVIAMEDPLDTIVKPRLEAAGADMTRVALLGGVRETGPHGEVESILQIPRDLDLIVEKCQLHQPALLVVDPLFAVMGYDKRGRFIKANDDQGVRRLTSQLKRLAERHNLTIWLLRHLNKGASGSALRRGSGTIAIAGQARSVMIAAKDLNEPSACVLAMTKTNLATPPHSQRFRVIGKGAGSQIEWLGISDLSADDLVQPGSLEDREQRLLIAAKEFLEWALENGGRTWEDLVAAANEKGITEMTLRRGRKKLALVKEYVRRNHCVWRLRESGELPPLAF
jgi:hypothetical protein